MNKNVIFIVGLPCSGKSTLGKKLLKETNNSIFVDDPKVDSLDTILEHLKNPTVETLIIADVSLCFPKLRAKANDIIKENYELSTITWIFFENSPEKCIVNYIHRKNFGDDRAVANAIMMYTREYIIPEFSTVYKIWQPEKNETV